MLQHDDPVLFPKKLRTNRNQSLYFLWNNIEIMEIMEMVNKAFISPKFMQKTKYLYLIGSATLL
jgi:hypothetical protein